MSRRTESIIETLGKPGNSIPVNVSEDEVLAAILKVKPTADMPRRGGPHPFRIRKPTKPKPSK